MKNGYLFDFKNFTELLLILSKDVFKQHITKVLEKMELSEGIIRMRRIKGV